MWNKKGGIWGKMWGKKVNFEGKISKGKSEIYGKNVGKMWKEKKEFWRKC